MTATRLGALVATLFFAGAVAAQERFPSKPITMVAPLSAGTTSDMVARAYAERLSARIGQQVVVVNRPGAGGSIAALSVAKAAPDGYTIMLVNSQHSINPVLYKDLQYDTLRDFAGLALIGEAPSIVVVHPSLNVRTWPEFVALAKQKPGVISYGSAGIGTSTHLAGAILAARAGIDIVHVPYKGQELMPDMLAGRVQAMFVPVPFLLQHIREGKLAAIAVTSKEWLRVPLEVKPVAEQGVANFDFFTYYGFIAPAKTPRPIVDQLSRAIRQTGEDKEIRDRFAGQAIFRRDLGPAEFDAYIRADMERSTPEVRQVTAGDK